MFLRAAALATLMSLAATQLWACEGKSVLFEDRLQDDTGGWPLSAEQDAIKDGGLNASVPGRQIRIIRNPGFFFEDADICADLSFRSDAATAGIVFWFEDYDNHFIFGVNTSGGYFVTRKYRGKWVYLVPATDSPAVKKEQGAVNTLRVTVKGTALTFYVNGEKLRQVRGQGPKDPWQFGLFVESASDTPATALLSNVKVTDAP